MDPNFCFWDVLAMNIQLLAASATDASLNVSQSLVDFVCKSAATKAMADLMIDYKRVNKTIMQFSKYGDYDVDAPPFMSCGVRFHNRTKTKFKTINFLSGFACDDTHTIMYLQHIAEELDILRKRVHAWYKNEYGSECGVTARYTANESIGYPESDIVMKMVNEFLSDNVLKDLFINLLNKTSPGFSSTDRDFFVEAILNGTFFFKTQSTTAFHYIPEMLELGFPSSKSNASRLNIELFEDLVIRAHTQGRSRRDTLALFILVWAAMDGSILKNSLRVLIDDDEKMIKFFRDIIHELHEGVPYCIREYNTLFPIRNTARTLCI